VNWPFNSSNSFLLGLIFGAIDRVLGSFGTLKEDLIPSEEDEENIDETCKEAM
jgi:hypothetical protein